jgi:hypothetical protein
MLRWKEYFIIAGNAGHKKLPIAVMALAARI